VPLIFLYTQRKCTYKKNNVIYLSLSVFSAYSKWYYFTQSGFYCLLNYQTRSEFRQYSNCKIYSTKEIWELKFQVV